MDRIEISNFKDTMTELQAKNIIYDNGKGGKDSFYVNNDINNTDSLINSCTGGEYSEVKNYINDKFHETLFNMIKSEVKN